MTRRILDIIADVLTLLALTVAAVGHVGFGGHLTGLLRDPRNHLWAMQVREVTLPPLIGSGVCLGLLGVVITLSLVISTGPEFLARLECIGAFGFALGAMLFQILLVTAHARVPFPGDMFGAHHEGQGWLILGIIATGFAIFFSLVRMIWTMPPRSAPALAAPERDMPRERRQDETHYDEPRRPRPHPPALPIDPLAMETERILPEESQIRPNKEES